MKMHQELLLGTDHLNPQLTWVGPTAYYQGKPLPAFKEGLQLLFKATGCTRGHYRLMTPSAVSSKPANMSCCYCQQLFAFKSERGMSMALQLAGLDTITTWQYHPKWLANGRVNFYVFSTGVVIQVDGSAHTEGIHNKRKLPQLMQQDMDFNLTAWQAGAKVVRVLETDLGHPQLQEQLQLAAGAVGRRTGPFLLLSPGYDDLVWLDSAAQQYTSYVPCFKDAIADGCTEQSSSGGWTWLLPPTL